MSPQPLTIQQELARDGYSQEEKYFYELNRDLIERRRRQLDVDRDRRRAAAQGREHWMRCPKCGSQMEEANLLGILVEQCPACQGFYLDPGELQTLLEVKRPETVLDKVKRLFPREVPPPKLF